MVRHLPEQMDSRAKSQTVSHQKSQMERSQMKKSQTVSREADREVLADHKEWTATML